MSSEAPTDAPAGPPPTESKRTCVEQCCTAAVSPSRRRRGSAAVRSRLAPGCCALAAHGRQDGRGAALRTFPPSHHRSLCLRAHSTAHRPENWRKVRPRAAQTPVFLPPLLLCLPLPFRVLSAVFRARCRTVWVDVRCCGGFEPVYAARSRETSGKGRKGAAACCAVAFSPPVPGHGCGRVGPFPRRLFLFRYFLCVACV